jgi:hypothetical protein
MASCPQRCFLSFSTWRLDAVSCAALFVVIIPATSSKQYGEIFSIKEEQGWTAYIVKNCRANEREVLYLIVDPRSVTCQSKHKWTQF